MISVMLYRDNLIRLKADWEKKRKVNRREKDFLDVNLSAYDLVFDLNISNICIFKNIYQPRTHKLQGFRDLIFKRLGKKYKWDIIFQFI